MSFQPSALFTPEIKQLLAEKNYKELKAFLQTIGSVDLAEGWSAFSPAEQVILFKLLSIARAVEIFEELEVEQQMHLLSTLEPGALGPVLEEVDPKDAARLFHRLPERVVKRMMGLLKREKVERISAVLSFPEGAVGSRMKTDVLDLRPNHTVRQALDKLRVSTRLHQAGELEPLYVVDDKGRLLGMVSPRALIAAPSDMKLSDVMGPVQLIKIRAESDQEDAAKIFTKYKLLNAPVVDAENRLLGSISVDDILTVVSEEATEDIAKMAGTGAGELETGSIAHVVRLRMPWLLASWFGGILASFVISRFEHTLTQVVALASFMPVIAGMGGNVGTQSSTIVVRGLATGRIEVKEMSRMIWRELRIGLLLGLGYGALLGSLAYFRFGRTISLAFPVVVALGILTSMTVAAVMGALTPMVVKQLKVDPAVCSAPFVSTATDIISLLTYFTFATWLLL